MLRKFLIGRLSEIEDDLLGLMLPAFVWGYAHLLLSLVGPIIAIPILILPIVGPIPASLYGVAYGAGLDADTSTSTLFFLSLGLAVAATILNFLIKAILGAMYKIQEDGNKQGFVISIFQFFFYTIPIVIVIFATFASSVRLGGILFGFLAKPLFPNLFNAL